MPHVAAPNHGADRDQHKILDRTHPSDFPENPGKMFDSRILEHSRAEKFLNFYFQKVLSDINQVPNSVYQNIFSSTSNENLKFFKVSH